MDLNDVFSHLEFSDNLAVILNVKSKCYFDEMVIYNSGEKPTGLCLGIIDDLMLLRLVKFMFYLSGQESIELDETQITQTDWLLSKARLERELMIVKLIVVSRVKQLFKKEQSLINRHYIFWTEDNRTFVYARFDIQYQGYAPPKK